MVLLQDRSFTDQTNERQSKKHFTVIDIGSKPNEKENKADNVIKSDQIVINVPEDLPPVDNVDVTKYKVFNNSEEAINPIQVGGKYFFFLMQSYRCRAVFMTVRVELQNSERFALHFIKNLSRKCNFAAFCCNKVAPFKDVCTSNSVLRFT